MRQTYWTKFAAKRQLTLLGNHILRDKMMLESSSSRFREIIFENPISHQKFVRIRLRESSSWRLAAYRILWNWPLEGMKAVHIDFLTSASSKSTGRRIDHQKSPECYLTASRIHFFSVMPPGPIVPGGTDKSRGGD